MKNLAIFSLLFLFVFSACRKDENNIEVIKETPNPNIENYVPAVNNISASVTGFIVDENEMPLADVSVRLGNDLYTTDAYGHFFVDNATMNSLGTLVRVEKNGYFDGSRRFFPQAGKNSRIKIQLLEKNFNTSFNTADGGVVNMPNGASVNFSANSIKSANGDLYTGTVHVASKWLDPSSVSTLNQMPGNLQGLNTEVEQMALGTYGMIAVELQNDAGEPLNIAAGKTAQINMPVPASLVGNAPAQIPLWSYNETHGLWVEEATATLQNGVYVGDVTHFSFWNCDIPFDYVNLEMTLVDDNGDALSNYRVDLETTNGALGSGSGYSNGDGNVAGFIPANEVLTMNVLDACGIVLFTQDIGPFDMDTDLGNVVVTGSSINSTTITGTLLDCNGAPLTNGLVVAEDQGYRYYHYTTSSSFSMSFSSCSSISSMNVTAINLDNLEQSSPITITTNTVNDLGDINACGTQLENYISITVDGVTAVFENAGASSNSTGSSTFVYSESSNGYVGFGFGGITDGDYSTDNLLEAIISESFGWNISQSSNIPFSNFQVTEYSATKLVGTFSGQLDNNGTSVSVSGSFNITL